VKACHGHGEKGKCGVVDCEWGGWSDWSGCTCSCEGGTRTRTRHIEKAPRHGGAPCEPHAKEEVAPCNTEPCPGHCVDGKWGDWGDWNVCSASCGGGTAFRTRKITRMANQCGTPPSGLEIDTKMCNLNKSCSVPVNCEFGNWGEWSDCTGSCDGVKRRERRIQKYGEGEGDWCIGALKELSPCNPGPHESVPTACGAVPPVDCEVGNWSSWSNCSSKCGAGVHSKKRRIITYPKHGGKACPAMLSMVKQCHVKSCDGGPGPVNCKVGEWQDWGGCYKCGGLRKRFRHIEQYNSNGGTPCPHVDTEEVGKCHRTCDHHKKTYCIWDDWSSWSKCTAECGSAKKSRKRMLKTTHEKTYLPGSTKDLISEFSSKLQRTQQLQASNVQELAVAFFGGGLTLLVLLGAYRVFRPSSGVHSHSQREEQETFDREALDMRMPLDSGSRQDTSRELVVRGSGLE